MADILKFPARNVIANSNVQYGDRTHLELHSIDRLIDEHNTGMQTISAAYLERLYADRSEMKAVRIDFVNNAVKPTLIERLDNAQMYDICRFAQWSTNNDNNAAEQIKAQVISEFKVESLKDLRQEQFPDVMIRLYELHNQRMAH